MRIAVRAGLVGWMGCIAACSNEPTEIVLAVDSDLSVPGELDAIAIEIDSSEIGGDVESASVALDGAAATELPGLLGILHQGESLGPVRVEVRGMLDGSAIPLERVALVSFIRNRSSLLRMDLLTRCMNETCGPGQTCGEDGCRSQEVTDEELAGWTGSVDLDGGAMSDGGSDDGETPDASDSCVGDDCECPPATGDCDHNPGNGCETQLDDRQNCFACDNECQPGHRCDADLQACAPGLFE